MNTFTSISKDISSRTVNLISALINMYYEQTKAHAEAVHSAFCYVDKHSIFRVFPSPKAIYDALTKYYDSDLTDGINHSGQNVEFKDKSKVSDFIQSYFRWLSVELAKNGQISIESIDQLFVNLFGDYN